MIRACSAVLTALLCCAPLAFGQQAEGRIALVGVTVVDPTTGVVPNATVLIAGRTIEQVARAGAEVPPDARVINLSGRYLTPGLIDAHVHIRDAAAARRALLSGVTTARSMGVSHFVDVGLRELAARGVIEAPEILAAGYHVRPAPAEGLFIDAPELADLYPSGVQGAEAVRRVARVLVDRRVDVIKTTATERAGLPETDPRKPLYSEDELRALVEEAEGAGIPVAAHAHGDEGARAAVLAGVRSIEHGTYLSDTTLRAMATRGTYLVPTIAVVTDLTQPGGDYDVPALQIRGRHMLSRLRETAGRAHRFAVRLVTATDTGYGPGSVVRLSHELMELVGIGLTPLEALRAATTAAAALLGVADRTGRVAAGFEADLLVLERNPFEDIGAFQDPLMVINNGRIVLDRTSW